MLRLLKRLVSSYIASDWHIIRLLYHLLVYIRMITTAVRHIAIIPDGNRTWAEQNDLPTMQWHLQGQRNSMELMTWVFSHTPITTFTIRGLSTENLLHRTQQELDYLADIYESALGAAAEFMTKKQISLRWIGSPTWMSKRLITVLEEASQKLTFDSDKTVCLGINYWWHDEIIRGVHKRHQQWADMTQMTADWFGKYLDLYGLPAVDLVVRTKAHLATRISGYLLRWIAYAELYFTEVLFPDFSPDELQKALDWFEEVKEHRNFGK